jgi:hypothetical protein
MLLSQKTESRRETVLATGALVLGLFSAATMLAVGYLDYTRFPWFDAWAYWTEYLNARSWTFIFDKMNEHRIVLTRLLYIADTACCRADTRLLVVSSFLVQFGSSFLLYRMTCSAFALSRPRRVYAAGLILAFCFAAPQWINFTWTFLTCFLTVPFGAIASFICLTNSVADGPDAPLSLRWIFASGAMALVATCSMSNGLLVWPLLVVMAATLRLPKGVVLGFTAATLVAFATYMAGAPVAQGSITQSLQKPWQIVPFALAYLGSAFDEPMLVVGKAFGQHWDAYRVPLTVLAGALGVTLVLRLAVAEARKPSVDRRRLPMLFTLAFFMTSSAVIALGRTKLTLDLALTSRYVTASLLFWVCLLLIFTSMPRVQRSGSVASGFGIRVAVLILACFVGGFPQLPKVAYAADTERFLAEGEYALINDVFALEAWGRFYMTPGEMIPIVRYFRDRRFSSFEREWTHWIGDSVSAHYVLSMPSDCTGALESVGRLSGSYNPAALATGWAYDRRASRAPDLLVFADPSQRIVGFSSGTRRRPDLAASVPEAARIRVGWVAYLPAGRQSDVSLYVVLGDGRSLCKVTEAHIPGSYLTAPARKAGQVVQGVQVTTYGDWTREKETWSSRTVKSGHALLRIGPVPCGSGASIGLPLITSSTASSIRVSVNERRTGKVLAEADPPPGISAWDLWRLDVPVGAPAATCDYVVEDNDNDPASWVAAGLPRAINP